MKNTILMLLKLSEVDAKTFELKDSQSDIPKEIQEIQKKIQSLQTQINEFESQLSTLQADKTETEEKIQTKKDWISRRQEQMQELKSNKEYQAGLKEVATAKKELSDLETHQIEVLTQIEELSKKLAEAQENTQPQIDTLEKEITEKNAAFESINPEIEAQEKTRQSLAVEIAPKVLAYYDQIRQRISPATSKAENGICTECGTRIPPQLYNQLFQLSKLHSCPRCRRILYLEETLQDEND